MRVLRIRILSTGFDNSDAAEEGRRWQEAELRRKDETFAAAEEKHRRQVQILPASKPLRTAPYKQQVH
jgi:hypothetical protein